MAKCTFCQKELSEGWVGNYHLDCAANSCVPRPHDLSKCRRCQTPLKPPSPGKAPFIYCYPCYFEIFKVSQHTSCKPLGNGQKGWKGVTEEGVEYTCEILPPGHQHSVEVTIDGKSSYRSAQEVEYIRTFYDKGVNWYEETPDTLRELIKNQEEATNRRKKK